MGRLFVSFIVLILVGVTTAIPFIGENEFINGLITQDPWLSKVIGNFHPVILHLPIGLVFLALTLEVMGWLSFGKWKPVTTMALFLAIVTSVLACITGYVDFIKLGGEDPELILHMRFAVGFVGVLALAFFFKIWGKNANGRGFFYALFIFVAAGLMGYGAHLGGEAVHGPLFPKRVDSDTDADVDMVVLKPVPERLVYEDVVVPILAAKCYRCHSIDEDGSKNKKGGLLMDSFAGLIDGGDEEGPTIIPGDAKESPMMVRIHLPFEDEYHMPPFKKKKPENQLVDAEVEILTWWINNMPKGIEEAPEDQTLSAIGAPQTILDAVTSLKTPQQIEEERKAKELAIKAAEDARRKKMEALEGAYNELQKDEQLSGGIKFLSQNSSDLEFSAVSLRKSMGDEHLRKLTTVNIGLVKLHLGATSVSDAAIGEVIPQLTELRKLNLSQTAVTDQTLEAIGKLENLEWLNLYGTEVTDAGLKHLENLGKLKKLYLWESKATDAGAKVLQEKLPGLEVFFGID